MDGRRRPIRDKLKFDAYTPQDKQMELHRSPANEILFGGAAGPGKSHALRHEGAVWCSRIPNLQVYLFRRTNPELEKTHIIKSQKEFPANVGTFAAGKKRWDWFNGSMFHFCHCQYEKDVFNFQGAEIHLLLIDEITTFTTFIYDYLRARVRCEMEVPDEWKHKVPGIIVAGNPGGVGHQFCKERWVDFAEPYKCKRAPRKEGGMLRQYIPGRLQDNPILMKNDPNYIHRLDALPEPYRSAYLDGDWNLFMGQMFAFNHKHHCVKPMPVPDDAQILFTFDWGFGKPYSCNWFWVDNDKRLYLFAEMYGCVEGQPDMGLRQTDDQIAELILIKEEEQGILGRNITHLAGPDCWSKKPGGGMRQAGDSTAVTFASEGVHLIKADPSRIHKIRQFHLRLRTKLDADGELEETPMLQVYDTCTEFIRTIQLMQADLHNPEDIDTKLEDHPYDSACHAMMHLKMGGTTTDNATIMELAAQAGV